MKIKDIKEYELGKHCFGDILTVNGKDYEDISKEDAIEFILDMFENDLNSEILIMETFKNALEYLQAEMVENDSSSCDQCGDWNYYSKYVVNE